MLTNLELTPDDKLLTEEETETQRGDRGGSPGGITESGEVTVVTLPCRQQPWGQCGDQQMCL